jgi:predicted RNA polymerase sigma factor
LCLRSKPLLFGPAAFRPIRGMFLRAAGRMEEAAAAFAAAARLAPGCRGYQVMLASLQTGHELASSQAKPNSKTGAANDRHPNL